ncbi:MAG: RNA polymerase sigma factor [Ktedonobacterales bacterium]
MSGDTREEREEDDAIRRCQQGEIAGLGALVARYQIPAVRLAYLLTGDHALADDVAQESFLLAYRGIKRFRLGEPFAPWFFRIVTNTARQQLRSARRRREISLDALTPDESGERRLGVAPDTARASHADPAEQAERTEAGAALLTLLESLPHKQREAVALRYYLGYSDQQIARILGCRLGTVQQRLHAGRASLQQAVRRRYPWLLSALSTLSTLSPSDHAGDHQETQRHVTSESGRV